MLRVMFFAPSAGGSRRRIARSVTTTHENVVVTLLAMSVPRQAVSTGYEPRTIHHAERDVMTTLTDLNTRN